MHVMDVFPPGDASVRNFLYGFVLDDIWHYLQIQVFMS